LDEEALRTLLVVALDLPHRVLGEEVGRECAGEARRSSVQAEDGQKVVPAGDEKRLAEKGAQRLVWERRTHRRGAAGHAIFAEREEALDAETLHVQRARTRRIRELRRLVELGAAGGGDPARHAVPFGRRAFD